jgi:hypothetical protein
MLETEIENQVKTSDDENTCMVKSCPLPIDCIDEVVLEKRSGDVFLFTGKFCAKHHDMFLKTPAILAQYVRMGHIRGIDSNPL